MNEAIKLAIEKGGYKRITIPFELDQWNYVRYETDLGSREIPISQIMTDPLFWQALGKALGWGMAERPSFTQPRWQYEALYYFQLVLTSGDTEKFWKDLLSTNKQSND